MAKFTDERVEVKCPYCGAQVPERGDAFAMNIGLCYPEDGGCDKYFAFKIEKTVNVRTHKIEGQEKAGRDKPFGLVETCQSCSEPIFPGETVWVVENWVVEDVEAQIEWAICKDFKCLKAIQPVSVKGEMFVEEWLRRNRYENMPAD